ncbi:MAG: hypothetical protein JW795_10785 [Chitinivibrionales bacterium]|nr:hypothetical protein [Chitinivibrionales bacterium]
MEDPIIDEVRKIRDDHAKKFNYDLNEIFKDLKEKEKKLKRKLISRPPRLLLEESAEKCCIFYTCLPWREFNLSIH